MSRSVNKRASEGEPYFCALTGRQVYENQKDETFPGDSVCYAERVTIRSSAPIDETVDAAMQMEQLALRDQIFETVDEDLVNDDI